MINFLTQVVTELAMKGAPLELWYFNKECLKGDVVVRGHLEHSDNKRCPSLVKQGKQSKELQFWIIGGQT